MIGGNHMEQTIQSICLFCEWIHLASRVATKTTSTETAVDIAQRYNIDVDQIKLVLKPCFDFEEKLSHAVDPTMHDFDFFFTPIRSEQQSLAQSLVPLFNEPIFYHKQDFSDISSKQWLHLFTTMLSNMLDEDDIDVFVTKNTITDISSLVQTAINSDLDESAKYRFIVATTQPVWCIQRLWDMYQKHAYIWQQHEQKLNEVARSHLSHWLSQYSSVFELIEEKIHVKGIMKYQTVTIIPSIFNFNSLTILNKDPFDYDQKEPVLHVGFLIFDLRDAISRLPQENERMLFLMKMLADKSKFEILRICKDKAMYGQQVANHLKLTTATTSYHLNALVNVGYLSLNVEANRIYYQTQTEKIKQDMQLISSMFE